MPNIVSSRIALPAGGGSYDLPSLSIGIFLNDQPTHRFSHCSTRTDHRPLTRNQGWMLPAGSNGFCEYDDALEFVLVSVDQSILSELEAPDDLAFDAVVGTLDPLLLNLCLNAGPSDAKSTLYKESMDRALAAQVLQLVKPRPNWHRGIDDPRLRRVLDYIHDNLGSDLSLTSMAELAAMSGTHFAKAFKKSVGSSPLQYVIAQRLELASILLRTTKLGVAEIAWRVGYQDLSRFGQHFKRRFGATPAAFRAG